MADAAPDVQNFDAPRPYKLTRVGVRGVRKPVKIHRPGQEPHDVTVDFDLFGHGCAISEGGGDGQ